MLSVASIDTSDRLEQGSVVTISLRRYDQLDDDPLEDASMVPNRAEAGLIYESICSLSRAFRVRPARSH